MIIGDRLALLVAGTVLVLIGGLVTSAAEEITIRDHDDVINEIKEPTTGKVLAKTHSKIKGYYRGNQLVLLEHRKKVTLTTDKGKEDAESTFYFVVANGRSVARIEKPTFALSSVISPWPIQIEHVNRAKDGKGSGHCNLSIPAIGFFESLEFEEGELQPLQTGERFEAFKAGMLKAAEEFPDPERTE